MSKFYQILPPKIAKLVEITLEKHISPKFPRYSCPKKRRKFAKKTNTDWNLLSQNFNF
jgi:hypothetical protein